MPHASNLARVPRKVEVMSTVDGHTINLEDDGGFLVDGVFHPGARRQQLLKNLGKKHHGPSKRNALHEPVPVYVLTKRPEPMTVGDPAVILGTDPLLTHPCTEDGTFDPAVIERTVGLRREYLRKAEIDARPLGAGHETIAKAVGVEYVPPDDEKTKALAAENAELRAQIADQGAQLAELTEAVAALAPPPDPTPAAEVDAKEAPADKSKTKAKAGGK